MINCDTTVSISIISKSDIQAIVYHIFLKDFDMGGSTARSFLLHAKKTLDVLLILLPDETAISDI